MTEKSYERRLYEFIADTIINSSDVASAFAAIPHIDADPKFSVFVGINEDDPPPFLVDESGESKSRGVVVVWLVKPAFHDDKRLQAMTIILSVGHRDEGDIDLAGGSKQQRGKMNNADLSETVGRVVCRALQKSWEHKTKCNLNIEQLLDNFYPNFVHQLSITAVYPKDYRSPLF